MAILNNSNAISSGGYDINNSLRFRSSATAYLNRTLSTPTNNKIWTLSLWVKRSTLTTTQILFGTASEELRYIADGGASGVVDSFQYNAGAGYGFRASATYRDVSAWYHLVIATDTTQATAANRVKFYVNGVQATTDGTYDITQNTNTQINSAVAHNIGRRNSGSLYFDGYMTEINFVDGQQLTPSSFGETDTTTGSWKPKAYTGTYGTNGFYLKFSDIATTSGSNAGLGKDFSGNANYFTTNNISVTAGTTYDAMIDSPTLTSATVANYCVFNSLASAGTFSNANLNLAVGSTAESSGLATIALPSTGKYYWEVTVTAVGSDYLIGIYDGSNTTNPSASGTFYVYRNTGQKQQSGSTTSYGSSYTTNDIIGVAVDMDAGTITFYKNNTSQGQAFSGISGSNFRPTTYLYNNASAAINFGQRPFTYTPPSGYVRLNTFNLPDSTIVKGNTVMDATTYTGTGASLSVTNAGAFKPDFVWVKGRSGATDHAWYDSVRGTTKQIESNTQTAETTEATGLTAFGTSGFTVGSLAQMNTSAATYVGWQWQAGQGSTTTGTGTGGITSVTQSVNATAGFSIVTYTGSGSNGTVTHGLGVAPKMIIVRIRNGTTNNWRVYNSSLTSASYFLYLNGTQPEGSDATLWNSTAPTSSVFSLGTNGDVNASTYNYVAYCWSEIAGFSKFGKYTGNGSSDGTFVYTGFRPKFVMIKSINLSDENWTIFDTSRNTYNLTDLQLFPNLTNADLNGTARGAVLDLLSNGFKLRGTNGEVNSSSGTYIYMAFAENPFKNANAR
jgi:hypothetical protein